MGEDFAVTVWLRSGRDYELPHLLSGPQVRAFRDRVSTGKERTITIEWPEPGVTVTFDREAIELVETLRA